MAEKRPGSPLANVGDTALSGTDPSDSSSTAVVLAKRPRNELVARADDDQTQVMEAGPPRTSNLEAPIMQLTGHQGEIFAAKFHPDGNILASTGFEREIFFWNVYGDCSNYNMIYGAHTGAILDMRFSSEDGLYLYTASSDRTVGVFDVYKGMRVKRLKGHTSYVNSVHPARRGQPLIVSGSDDCTVKIWDQRKKNHVHSLNNTYQVTAVSFNDASNRAISGGLDETVKVWDLRNPSTPEMSLSGHTDMITSLMLSPDGSSVLTNAMDNSLRMWDIRPYASGDRCVSLLTGHAHNFERNLIKCAWSPDGLMIAAGSADRNVYIWDTQTRRIMYKLPGHLGSVNDVDFHRIEPISKETIQLYDFNLCNAYLFYTLVLSASSDKSIYLGEFEF